MGVKGQELIGCFAGGGTYVTRGERRIADMERHATCLRERLNRLESMLPDAITDAPCGVNKNEKSPKLRIAEAKSKRYDADMEEVCAEKCNLIDNEEGQCVLRTLAKKEKTLRKQIFDMESREEGYMNALWHAKKEFEQSGDSGKDFEQTFDENSNGCCLRSCDMKEQISQLEAYGRKLCLNLKNLQKNRAELTEEAEVLSKELKITKRKPDAVEKDPAMKTGGIRTTNKNSSACPCGEPVKCNSCIICSCAEWERDLEGGGDDEPEEHEEKPVSLKEEEMLLPVDRCRCGCCETSSESACGCGYCENTPEVSCDCDDVESIQTTITTTTIPSTVENAIRSHRDERNKDCHLCSAAQPCNKTCEICECESNVEGIDRKRGNANCEMCRNAPQSIKLPCSDPYCNYDKSHDRNGVSRCSICRSTASATKDLLAAMQKITSNGSQIPISIEPASGLRKAKQEKVRDGLESLKSNEESLKKLLKDCGCGNSLATDTQCPCTGLRPPLKKTTSAVIETVQLLHNKCRTKDGIIVALADELKRNRTEGQSDRILKSLTNPDLCCAANDFDRSELWRYLQLPSQRHNDNNNATANEDCNMRRRDLLFGLIVLFLFILSHLIRSYAQLPSCPYKCFRQLQSHAWNLYMCILKFVKFLLHVLREIPNAIIILFSIVRDYVIHLWTYFGSVGAIFGSLSCVRTVWSLAKRLIVHFGQTFSSRDSLRIFCHGTVSSLKNFFGSALVALYVPIDILLLPVHSCIRFLAYIVSSIYLLTFWIVSSIVKPMVLLMIRLQRCLFGIGRFVVWCVSTLKTIARYAYTRLFSLPNILFLLFGFAVNRIVTVIFETTF